MIQIKYKQSNKKKESPTHTYICVVLNVFRKQHSFDYMVFRISCNVTVN